MIRPRGNVGIDTRRRVFGGYVGVKRCHVFPWSKGAPKRRGIRSCITPRTMQEQFATPNDKGSPMEQTPLTVFEIAQLYGRTLRQVRYAIRILNVEPATVIRPRRYDPAALVPALGPMPSK